MPYGTINVDKVVDTSGGVLAPISSVFRSRIINGAMVFDQRNAGAAVTVNSTPNTFLVDRWFANGESADGVFTGQQSTTAPVGFNNSLKFTVTTADASIGATQGYTFRQRIEGYNFADLGWGTANAKTITVSFWVQSSVTGTFGGSLFNINGDRVYVFSYSISAANTWEYKTVTIAGDTTGTWNTTNGTGLNLTFSLGVGSSNKGTAGVWGSTFYFAPSGSVDLISTLNATLFLTGVQLEKGSTATSFEYRPYGSELSLCQRYFYREVGTNGEYSYFATGGAYSTTAGRFYKQFPVTMRATPTYSPSGSAYADGVNLLILFTLFLEYATPNAIRLGFTCASGNGAGHAVFLTQNTSTVFSQSFSAEL